MSAERARRGDERQRESAARDRRDVDDPSRLYRREVMVGRAGGNGAIQRQLDASSSDRAGDGRDPKRTGKPNAPERRSGSAKRDHPTVASPGGRLEAEADRIADRVVDDRPASAVHTPGPISARSSSVCVDCLQRIERGSNHRRSVTPADRGMDSRRTEGGGVETAGSSLPGGGRRLPWSARSAIEPSLGTSLGEVRIHTDAEAADAARALGARAFTYGNHVYFGRGEYRPNTREGKRVLTHELVHTLQQGRGREQIQRLTLPGFGAPEPTVEEAPGGSDRSSGSPTSTAAGSNRRSEGGWFGDFGSTSGAAWACARETGMSISRLVTLDFESLSELLGLPEPRSTGPALLDTVIAALEHPCLQVLPGSERLVDVAKLEELRTFLVGAWQLVREPGTLLTPLKEALGERVESVPGEAKSTVKASLDAGPVERSHFAGIWAHMEKKLNFLIENWWSILKQSAWEFIWPWGGIGKELTTLGGHIATGATKLWDLQIGAAGSALLEAWRQFNALAGRLYGWFFIASVLVGAALGAVFGFGGGALPGAVAGASFATSAGMWLLVSAVAAETVNLTKGVVNIALAEDREALNEAYEDVAESGIGLAIMGALALLGAAAARMARNAIARFPKFKAWLRKKTQPLRREQAWRDYDGDLSRQEWEARYDQLMRNKETGEFFERILQGEKRGTRQVRETVTERIDPRIADVRQVKGVGPKFGRRLNDADVSSVDDLLNRFGDSPEGLADVLDTYAGRARNILKSARNLDPEVSHTRYIDLQRDASIFEVKSGSPELTPFTRRQIEVDVLLRDIKGYDPTWVFYRGQPTPQLERALLDADIPFVTKDIPVDFVGVGAAGVQAGEESTTEPASASQ